MGRITPGSSNQTSGRTEESGGFWKSFRNLFCSKKTDTSIEMKASPPSKIGDMGLDGKSASATGPMNSNLADFDWNEIDYADPFDRLPDQPKADNENATEASPTNISSEHQTITAPEAKDQKKDNGSVLNTSKTSSQEAGALVNFVPKSKGVASTQSMVGKAKALIAVSLPKTTMWFMKLNVPAALVKKFSGLKISKQATSTPTPIPQVTTNLLKSGEENESYERIKEDSHVPISQKSDEENKLLKLGRQDFKENIQRNLKNIHDIPFLIKHFGLIGKFINFLYQKIMAILENKNFSEQGK